jgi:NADP-dependent 3-hydroxy acid dehydrogenase YdfG
VNALTGQLALVTGASGAIGGAVARALAGAGADVILAGRDSQRLAGVAAELGGRVREIAESDFAVPGAAAQLAARLATDGQGLDILVHAAGLFLNGDLAAADDLAFDRLLCVNLRAPLELTRGLLPALRRRQGQIVFVNSSVSGRRGVGLYAATKQGLRALADSLRDEVNAEGVRVLSVYPGRTASAMQQAILRAEGRDYDPARLLSPRDVAQSILGALLLERSAEITDLHIRPMRPLQS